MNMHHHQVILNTYIWTLHFQISLTKPNIIICHMYYCQMKILIPAILTCTVYILVGQCIGYEYLLWYNIKLTHTYCISSSILILSIFFYFIICINFYIYCIIHVRMFLCGFTLHLF